MTQEVNVEELLHHMAEELRANIDATRLQNSMMVGIHSGGVWIAQRLHRLLELQSPLGKLDISFYRDDFTRIGMNPQVRPSDLPVNVDDRHILLIDDVIYTGRTIRAALNEIFDYGRPASVVLATLVDRGGRELPIQPDVVGIKMSLQANQNVKLKGPDPLSLNLTSSN